MNQLTITYPPQLPISAHAKQIIQLIKDHQILIVAGETGSGKTTQLPKMCLEAGRKHIAHTQPRRLAARSVAERIASELEIQIGELVGYQVRFIRQTGHDTQIKLMTDGILLNEITYDPNLERYDTIIIDEAHERSLNIDFLLGYLKKILSARPELKVIITSATIDTKRFSEHFNNAPIVEVSGRGYPVEIRYRPQTIYAQDGSEQTIEQSEAIAQATKELMTEGSGDILVFCSGEREIRDAIKALEDHKFTDLELLPLHSRLSAAEQHRIFEQHSKRRIIVATNIAETSLTVPGIKYVIDAGTARISRYSTRTKVQRLPIEPISQASANQRSGRCGRIAPGIAIRLYSKEDFDSRPAFTQPEILRTNLASVILQMIKTKLGEISQFPFITRPDIKQINDGIRLLDELGALKKKKELALTKTGHILAELPIDPRLGRMLIEAERRGCLKETLIIVANLGIQDVREHPVEHRQEAETLHARFFSEQALTQSQLNQQTINTNNQYVKAKNKSGKTINLDANGQPLRHTAHTSKTLRANHNKTTQSPTSLEAGGDILAILRLWQYLKQKRRELSGNQFKKLCRNEYIHYLRTREWQDLHTQLKQICRNLDFRFNHDDAQPEQILISVLAGLLSNIGLVLPKTSTNTKTAKPQRKLRARTEYLGTRGTRFEIAPGSALTKSTPQLVMAVELVETSRLWARTVAPIEASWVEKLGKHLLKRSYGEPYFSASLAQICATEKTTLLGVPIIADRQINYGRVDADLAREIFIRKGLVEGEWHPNDRHANHDFLDYNEKVFSKAQQLTERTRGRHIIDDDDIYRFYDIRIPQQVNSGASFDRWWRNFHDHSFLEFDLELLTDSLDMQSAHEQFPDHWQIDDLNLPVSYIFEPDSQRDGATVSIPVEQLNQIPAAPFSWQVPGMRLELATELIRHLPKTVRKNFVPAPDFARQALHWLSVNHADMASSFYLELSRALYALTGIQVADDDWRPHEISPHLQLGFEVTRIGKTAVYGKDLTKLKNDLAVSVRKSIKQLAPKIKYATSWQFGEIERLQSYQRSGVKIVTYPALKDFKDAVAVDQARDQNEQRHIHRLGIRRLLTLTNPDPTKWVIGYLTNSEKLILPASPYKDVAALLADARLKAVEILAEKLVDLNDIRDEQSYQQLALQVRMSQADQMRKVVNVIALALEQFQEIRRNAASSVAGEEVLEQSENLVFDGFVSYIRNPWFEYLPRYLKAANYRLSSALANPARDLQQAQIIYALQDELDELVDDYGQDIVPDELDDISFMIEELRVQLFAQHLGTRITVSEKRIRKAMDIWRIKAKQLRS